MNIGNRETGSLYINKKFYLYIVGNFGAFPFDFDKRHHDQMTAPAPPKKFFEKNRPDIREPQRRCCTFAPLEIESGICAPTNKKLRAHRGGAAMFETTDTDRESIN
jgi:hypothetical protein